MIEITIETIVKAPIEKVWNAWISPEHIVNWNFASETWECPRAENDLRIGGRFSSLMAAKDKSFSFEFSGTYSAVVEHKLIEYDMDDKRHVKTTFEEISEGVKIVTVFDAEEQNSVEMQKEGWQSILNNFKKYVENE